MSNTRKVAFNTIVQYIGKAVITVISLVLVAALTRYLGVAGFGEYTTVFAYISFWAVFADFGLNWVLVREISKPGANVAKITNNIFTIRVILGIVVFATSFLVSYLFDYKSTIRFGIGVIAIAWFLTTLNSNFVAVFQSKMRMEKGVITEIIGKIVTLGLILLFISQGRSLMAIFWAYNIGNLINFILSWVLVLKYIKIKLEVDISLWKKLAVLSFPIGLSSVFHLIYFRIDTVILSVIKSSEDVGIYGAPYKILEMLLLIPTMFMSAALPILTAYHAGRDKRLPGSLQKVFDFLIILCFPTVFGVFILAEPIIHIIAGEGFVTASTLNIFGHPATAVTALKILILAVGLSFVSIIFYYLIIIFDKQRKLIGLYSLAALVNVILNIILIPKYSYVAAASVTFITELIILIFSIYIIKKDTIKLPKITSVYKCLIASLLMSIVVFFLKDLNLFLNIAIGAMVYVVIIYFLRVISKNDIMSIIKK